MKDSENRNFSITKRLLAGFLFWSLFLAVYPASFLSAEAGRAGDGMVYCPLSKKFQFIEPPESGKDEEPFEYLCASAKNKDFLFREIVLKNPLKAFTLDADGFEALAFDILSHGSKSLEKLTNFPNAPVENIVKPVNSSAAVNNRGEYKLIWKASLQTVSPALAARPPTAEESLFSPNSPNIKSAAISRRIAPRAPPVFS